MGEKELELFKKRCEDAVAFVHRKWPEKAKQFEDELEKCQGEKGWPVESVELLFDAAIHFIAREGHDLAFFTMFKSEMKNVEEEFSKKGTPFDKDDTSKKVLGSLMDKSREQFASLEAVQLYILKAISDAIDLSTEEIEKRIDRHSASTLIAEVDRDEFRRRLDE